MVNVSTRHAEPRDVPSIKRIGERAWNMAYDGVLAQATIDAAISEWYDNEALLSQVQDHDVAYFVADSGRGVTGFVSGGSGAERRLGELGAIYVDPDHWRTGTGTALVDCFEDFGRSQEWDAIQIRVLAENDIARSFYEKQGYERTNDGVVELFGEDTPEVIYRKHLD